MSGVNEALMSSHGVYIDSAQNTIENVMDLMVIMGIVLVLMEAIMVSTGM